MRNMILLCGCFAVQVPPAPEVLAVDVPGSPTGTISIRLSAPIDPDSAGWVTWQRLAAFVKLNVSQTAMKCFSW